MKQRSSDNLSENIFIDIFTNNSRFTSTIYAIIFFGYLSKDNVKTSI